MSSRLLKCSLVSLHRVDEAAQFVAAARVLQLA